MSQSNESSNFLQISKKQAILNGVGIGIVSGITAGLVMYSMSPNSGGFEKELSDIRSIVETNNQRLEEGSGSIDPEALSQAISDSLDAREEERVASIKRDKYKDFEDAPDDVESGDWIYGNPDARFTLYTFADTQCGYCQQFHGTPKELVDASEGAINTQYHSMAIINRTSEPQAVAAECAGRIGGNKAFWVYLNDLYEQATVATSSSKMTDIAVGMGLDGSEFSSCLSDEKVIAQVRADNSNAKSQGITGTPTTIVIDNKEGSTEAVSGARGAGSFIQVIQGMVSDDAIIPKESENLG